MENIRYFKEFEMKVIDIIKHDYRIQLDKMVDDLFEVLKTIALYLDTRAGLRHEQIPKIKIIVDSDFDGYASAKQIYQLFSTLGVSKELIEFIHLTSAHKNQDKIKLNSQDLLIVTDTSYGLIEYEGEGKVWWIDHHNISPWNIISAELREIVLVNTQVNTNEVIKDLSCGAFTYMYIGAFIHKLNVSLEVKTQLLESLEVNTKLEALLSMISDMMPINKYPAIYQGILESPKTDFYEGGKSRWCHDNRKYFNKYTSKINNLMRMERVDLIEELIRGNGGEFIQRDTERMGEDKRRFINSYFEPLTPEWEYTTRTSLVQIYQVPIDTNPIMRNHKGLLASMKTPKQRGLNYIILSRINLKGKYNYSVRTNLGINLQRYIMDNIEGVEVGGHSQAFGITLLKDKENDLKLVLENLLNRDLVKAENNAKEVIDFKEIKQSKEPLKELWEIALDNEINTYPTTVKFHYSDFEDVEVFLKRTVYYLLIEGKIQEVVSFDLEEKETLYAAPVCRENIYSKHSIDILEV